MFKSALLRDKADHCRRLTRQLTDAPAIEGLLALADRCIAEAEDLERQGGDGPVERQQALLRRHA